MSNPFLVKPSLQFNSAGSDPFTTPLASWIGSGEGPTDLSLVGVPLSKSSITFSGAHSHPQAFRQLWSSFQTYNWDENLNLAELTAADRGDVRMHVTDILECHQNIEGASQRLWNDYPSTTGIFIGGDHSITYPIVTGLKKAKSKTVGLIQLDAHLDVRDTQYGGPSNGTPMRSLIEQGVLQGENMVTIGLRSFANSKYYRTYAEEKGIILFSATAVKSKGIQEVIEWAIQYLDPKVDLVYVTFDIDVLDQCFVPGVPAIGPGGLTPDDLFYTARILGQWNKVIGMDMVCVDPTRDLRDITTRISLHLFLHFATGQLKRKRLFFTSFRKKSPTSKRSESGR